MPAWIERLFSQLYSLCLNDGLFTYDVGDVLAMLRAKDRPKVPATFMLGQCGGPPVAKNIDEFLRGLTKTVTIAGRNLPQAREVERNRLVKARRESEARRQRDTVILP